MSSWSTTSNGDGPGGRARRGRRNTEDAISALTLYAMDGVRIDAGYLPGIGGLCFVLAHGFTGAWRQPNTRRIAAVLNHHGGVIAIDFRGHGRSGGRSTVGDREVLDLDAAVRHARHLGYERVVPVGFSMGGVIVVRHAALHGGVEAVVAVSAPARWYYRETKPMRRVHWAVERPVGRLAVRLMKHTRISAAGWVREPEPPHALAGRISPIPFLVVHGDADLFLPLDHAEQLYAAANDPRELWIEQGYGHAEGAATPELIERIALWATDRSRHDVGATEH